MWQHPNPPLIGATPEERAECRMWTRRVDLNICEHMGNGFRFGEIRLIYRLTRMNKAAGDDAAPPRLPMTLNLFPRSRLPRSMP